MVNTTNWVVEILIFRYIVNYIWVILRDLLFLFFLLEMNSIIFLFENMDGFRIQLT